MSRRSIFFLFAFAVGFIFVFCDGFPLLAQETKTDEFTLEEITVTAQKRAQQLQKVATTVEAIPGSKLTDMGAQDLEDALANIASATVTTAGEEMTVTIRGMDNDSMPGDSFSQVAVTIDGSFSASWGVGTTGIYDMQRIEVLAGPQGTLYSRNSSGGVVNMISNDPKTDKVDASGSIGVGNYKLFNTQGMLNAPISDTLALRTAFVSTSRNGYVDNGTDDTDDKSVRLKLGFIPSDTLSAVLTYEYTKIGGKSQGDGVAAFEREDDVSNPWHSNSNGDTFVSNTQTDRYYMNFNLSTPIGALTFLPSYSKTSRHNIQAAWLWSDGSVGMRANDPRAVHAGQGREHFLSPQDEKSYELRMASNEDFFMKYVLGLYYYERSWNDKIYSEAAAWTYNGIVLSSPGTAATAKWGTKGSDSKAAFGNFTYPVTNAFRVTAGGRYTKENENEKGYDRMTGAPTSSKYSSGHFDWKAAVEYDLATNSMLWADVSTGYKQVRGSSADQKLMSYQVGAKNRFLDNKLQLNATGYYYDYSNFDIGRVASQYVPNTTIEYGGSGIGDAKLYGLDLSTEYVITSLDRVNFSLSYESAKVDQVVITYTYQGVENPALFPRKIVDAGKPLNNAPEFTIVLGYEHRFDLSSGATVTPGFTVRYVTKKYLEFYPDASNVPAGMDVNRANTEPSHLMADASMNFGHSSGKWNLNAFIKNITNHAEKNGFMRGDMRIGPPRTYGAVLSVTL
jgi:iron complex outermembrane recepter protein